MRIITDDLRTYSFLEDLADVILWINVTTSDEFTVNTLDSIAVVLGVVDIRENASFFVTSVQVGIEDTNVLASEPLLKNLTESGESITSSLTIDIRDPTFSSIRPGEEAVFPLLLEVQAKLNEEEGDTQKIHLQKTINVRVVSPAAPATIDTEVSPLLVQNVPFDFTARVRNDGDYPITAVRFLISGYRLKTLSSNIMYLPVVDPGGTAQVTFSLAIETMGSYAITLDTTYLSFGGYNVSESQTLLVTLKGESTISCEATHSTGRPIIVIRGSTDPPRPGVPVLVELSEDQGRSWTKLSDPSTISDGTYSYTWKPEKKGTFMFRASWNGDDSYVGSQSQEARIGVTRDLSHLTCSLSSSSVFEGDEVIVSGEVSPPRPSPTFTIYYSTDKQDWNVVSIIAGDQAGKFGYEWTPPEANTYYIKVGWEGDGEYYGEETVPLALVVKPKTTSSAEEFLSLISGPMGIIIVAVVVLAGWFLIRKRGKRAET